MHALNMNSRDDLDTVPVLPDDVPVTMPELPARVTITSFEQFKAISEPVRSRILGIIQNQPATAKQIADRLGATPGAIGHHLHVLEDAGLAKIVARRLVRGIVANYYTRTARIFNYNLPKDVTGGMEASLEVMNKAHDEMVEAQATINDDPYCSDGFPHIRLSPERARYYSERLQALVDEVLDETPDPDGKVYGIFVAMFMSPPYMQGPSTTNSSDAV
ncbi:MAG TPA: winged helix-turn-helix domain-containing protein [Ktedonobacteraceae bacterium]|nr:winged helix-turn-helix domain-containing protein [Ktedonobacteraceae bacterium]